MAELGNKIFKKLENAKTRLGNGIGPFEQKHQQKPRPNPEPEQIHPSQGLRFPSSCAATPFGCPPARVGFSFISFTRISAR